MKISDVVSELQKRLPMVTTLFNETFTIDSATVDTSTITFHTTEAHGLAVDYAVFVNGVNNGLTIDSVTTDGETATLTFTFDHGFNYDKNYTQYVTITGSDDSDGSYELTGVPDKNTLEIAFTGSDITGSAMVESTEGFDGGYTVTAVPSTQEFTVDSRTDIFVKPKVAISGGTASTKIRISGAADMDRFNAAYTAQTDKKCWLVVTPPTNRASRDRNVPTDAISGLPQAAGGVGYLEVRQAHIETVNLYAVIPASLEVSGRIAADLAEEIRWALYSSICMASVATLAKDSEVYAIMPVSDSYYAYLSDNTTYTHEYVFERTVYVNSLDIAQPMDQTAPFRGLSLELLPCDKETS